MKSDVRHVTPFPRGILRRLRRQTINPCSESYFTSRQTTSLGARKVSLCRIRSLRLYGVYTVDRVRQMRARQKRDDIIARREQ